MLWASVCTSVSVSVCESVFACVLWLTYEIPVCFLFAANFTLPATKTN